MILSATWLPSALPRQCLSYGLVLNHFGRVGWLAAFLFCACGAMRLARFNTLSGSIPGNFFQGLPIPVAAGMLSASIIFLDHYNLSDKTFLSFFLIALIYGLAFLMVSTIRFRSFKTFNLTQPQALQRGFHCHFADCSRGHGA